MGIVEPRKTIPANTIISVKDIHDDEKIESIPENCYYKIDVDRCDYDTYITLELYSAKEIPNPNYEQELERYEKAIAWEKQQKAEKQKKYRENKKKRELAERETYERLKKKFESDGRSKS